MNKNTSLDKTPVHLVKLEKELARMRNTILLQKESIDTLYKSFQHFETVATKAIDCQRKQYNKPEKPLRNYGFATPVKISAEMTAFMGLDPDVLCARTSVTKFVNTYIKENKLQNPRKKTEILPDEALQKILGTESIGKTITYFTIQKYMNQHFP